VDALGALLSDPDPEVAAVAARGLAARPSLSNAREALLSAYAGASPAGRAAIADALEASGTSLREAVEREARALWERNLGALASARGASRAGAAEEVGASARAEAVARLLPLVDPNRNPDRELAAAAARGLGEAGDWAARPHLEALLVEGDAALAEAAAAALARLGDPGAADALAEAARDGAGRIAWAAVEALSTLPEAPEVGTVLCQIALRAWDPALAARAARELRIRDADCPIQPLLARIGRPGASAAIAALGEMGVGADASAAAQRLLPLLDPARSPEPAVRIAALRALGRLKAQIAAAPVRERAAALAARAAEARRRWIAGRLPAQAAPGFDGPDEARLAAVIARAPGPPSGAAPQEDAALPPFIPAASAGAEELREALAAAGRLRAAGADRLLATLARDPEPAVRAGAVEGLAEMGGEAAAAILAGALRDPERAVRVAAAEGLTRLGPRGAGALIHAADEPDTDPDWRVALTRALGETGAAEAVPVLAARLDGPTAEPAAAALARLGSSSAIGPLVAALERPETTGRVALIDALAVFGSPEAAGVIARELTSDRPEIRAAAARALGRLRHEHASARLEALRSDYYGRVRRAAVEALAKLPAGPPRARP
jgi:HEAT repeat protein